MISPASTDLSDPTYLHSLLQKREIKLFTSLGKKMAAAGKAATYSTWMFEESDLIQVNSSLSPNPTASPTFAPNSPTNRPLQHAAKSFGERLIADRMSLAVQEADGDMQPILTMLNTVAGITVLT